MKSCKLLSAMLALQLSALMVLSDAVSESAEHLFSGVYDVEETRIDGYPANHKDFLHVLKWKRGTPVILAFSRTTSFEVIYITKYGTRQTNCFAVADGYSLTVTNRQMEVSRVLTKPGYMLPGTVTVERRIILKATDRGLSVTSTYQESGRSVGLVPWQDPVDTLSIHLTRDTGRRKSEVTSTGISVGSDPETTK